LQGQNAKFYVGYIVVYILRFNQEDTVSGIVTIVVNKMNELNWSQSDLARRIDKKPQNIQQFIAGRVRQPRYLLQMLEALNIPLEVALKELDGNTLKYQQTLDERELAVLQLFRDMSEEGKKRIYSGKSSGTQQNIDDASVRLKKTYG